MGSTSRTRSARSTHCRARSRSSLVTFPSSAGYAMLMPHQPQIYRFGLTQLMEICSWHPILDTAKIHHRGGARHFPGAGHRDRAQRAYVQQKRPGSYDVRPGLGVGRTGAVLRRDDDRCIRHDPPTGGAPGGAASSGEGVAHPASGGPCRRTDSQESTFRYFENIFRVMPPTAPVIRSSRWRASIQAL